MKKFFPLLALLLLATTACQDVIDVDVPQNTESITIYGRVTDSLGTRVSISLTAGYFDEGQVPMISDAQVYLYEDDVMVEELQPDTIEGEYHSEFSGTIGRSYAIEVLLPEAYNLPTTWRSEAESMKRVFEVDSFDTRYLTRSTEPQVYTEGTYGLVYFTEPQGRGDYYRVKRYLNDSLFAQEFFIFEDLGIDGVSFGGDFPGFSIYGPLEEGDSLWVEVSSLSRDYFEYLSLINEQVFQIGGPFDPPPSPIIGNIYNLEDPEEYGFGYFTASAVSEKGVKHEP